MEAYFSAQICNPLTLSLSNGYRFYHSSIIYLCSKATSSLHAGKSIEWCKDQKQSRICHSIVSSINGASAWRMVRKIPNVCESKNVPIKIIPNNKQFSFRFYLCQLCVGYICSNIKTLVDKPLWYKRHDTIHTK